MPERSADVHGAVDSVIDSVVDVVDMLARAQPEAVDVLCNHVDVLCNHVGVLHRCVGVHSGHVDVALMHDCPRVTGDDASSNNEDGAIEVDGGVERRVVVVRRNYFCNAFNSSRSFSKRARSLG